LLDLSFPLKKASVHFINSLGDIKRAYGFAFSSQDQWNWKKIPRHNRRVIFEEYNVPESGSEMNIWHIVKGSPAEKAGLLAGDRIVALNGKSFSSQEKFAKTLETLTKKSRTSESYKRSDGATIIRVVWAPVNFTVKRKTADGIEVLTLPVKAESVGNFDIIYRSENALNAYADGKNVFITEGIMQFVKTDEELQLVIAHELAHNIGKHREKKENNALAGAVLGAAIGSLATTVTGIDYSYLERDLEVVGSLIYSKDFEREADYLGMYILVNAGVQLDQVHKFWERMGQRTGGAGTFNLTHPSDAVRAEALKIIVAEIEHKKLSGQHLVPNR